MRTSRAGFKKTFTAAAVSLLAGAALAQEASDNAKNELPTVVVNATRASTNLLKTSVMPSRLSDSCVIAVTATRPWACTWPACTRRAPRVHWR